MAERAEKPDQPTTSKNAPAASVEVSLREGIELMINNWPVLKLAIENGWGEQRRHIRERKYKTDAQLREELIAGLTQYILEFDVDQSHIEDYLLRFMDENFFVVVEDDSERHLARLAYELYRDLDNGGMTKLEEIRQLAQKMSGVKVQAQYAKGENSDSEDDDFYTVDGDDDDDDDDGLDEEQADQNLDRIEEEEQDVQPQLQHNDDEERKQEEPQLTEEQRRLQEEGFIMVQKKGRKKNNRRDDSQE